MCSWTLNLNLVGDQSKRVLYVKVYVKTIAVINCGSPTSIQIQLFNYISIIKNSLFFLTLYYVIDFYKIDDVIVYILEG